MERTTRAGTLFGVVQKDVLKRKKSISDENLLYLNQNDSKDLQVEERIKLAEMIAHEQGTETLSYMNEKAGKKCRYEVNGPTLEWTNSLTEQDIARSSDSKVSHDERAPSYATAQGGSSKRTTNIASFFTCKLHNKL